MPEICKKFHRQPIGRKIKRILNGSGVENEESGVVTGMYSVRVPEWQSTYIVNWEPEGEQPFEEHLALKTIQSYYSSDDRYVNEEWVQDEIRILQSLDWRENKLPKKDSEEWTAALNKLNGKQDTARGKARAGNGRRKPATTVPTGTSNLPDDEPSNEKEKQNDKAAVTSGRSSIGRAVQRVTSLPAAALQALNATSARFQEAPQVLGQRISDALPSSSKKLSSGRPAASSGTTSAAITDKVQKAQDTIHAISQSPGKASGTRKRAAAAQAQGSPPPKRSSKHATTAAAPVVVVEDSEVVVDIDGDEAVPQKDVRPSGSTLQGSIAEIAKGLQAAPGSQARTSRSKGGSFEATGLLQQAEDDGQNGAASPAEPDAASTDQQEDMVDLPNGWQPAQIPQRVMAQPGDTPVEVYTAEGYEEGDDYEVDSIVAERKVGRATFYLVKWKGFAINPEESTPRTNLKDCKALDLWEEAKLGTSLVNTRSAQKGKKKKSGRKS